jgi:hypothetical protein
MIDKYSTTALYNGPRNKPPCIWLASLLDGGSKEEEAVVALRMVVTDWLVHVRLAL